MNIKEKIQEIDKDLAGRLSSGEIKLIAVSKYANDEQVIEAYEAGQRDFGENYILPALEKIERLNLPEARWHLTGPIQKNKVNKLIGKFETLQSIHSLELAEIIAKKSHAKGIKQKILLQINSTGDKNGFLPQEVKENFMKISELEGIEVLGLMTMGFFADNEKTLRKNETIYNEMRQIRQILQLAHSGGPIELSMGMSGDYSIAASCGATMIRLGSKIFQIEN